MTTNNVDKQIKNFTCPPVLPAQKLREKIRVRKNREILGRGKRKVDPPTFSGNRPNEDSLLETLTENFIKKLIC